MIMHQKLNSTDLLSLCDDGKEKKTHILPGVRPIQEPPWPYRDLRLKKRCRLGGVSVKKQFMRTLRHTPNLSDLRTPITAKRSLYAVRTVLPLRRFFWSLSLLFLLFLE